MYEWCHYCVSKLVRTDSRAIALCVDCLSKDSRVYGYGELSGTGNERIAWQWLVKQPQLNGLYNYFSLSGYLMRQEGLRKYLDEYMGPDYEIVGPLAVTSLYESDIGTKAFSEIVWDVKYL